MTNRQNSGGFSRVLAVLLTVVDLALLCWIGISWYRQRNTAAGGFNPEEFVVGGEVPDNGGASSGGSIPDTGTASSGGNGVTTGGLAEGSGNAEEPEPAVPVQDGASRFGAVGRPTEEEFTTWDAYCVSGGIPSGARMLTDFREITGEWKGLIRYSSPDLAATELVGFTVSGDAGDASLTFSWYLIRWDGDGEWFNEEDMEDTVYRGSFSDGTLAVNGAGNIRLTVFFEWDGQQFAAGEMDVPDGSRAVVGMIRP